MRSIGCKEQIFERLFLAHFVTIGKERSNWKCSSSVGFPNRFKHIVYIHMLDSFGRMYGHPFMYLLLKLKTIEICVAYRQIQWMSQAS